MKLGDLVALLKADLSLLIDALHNRDELHAKVAVGIELLLGVEKANSAF